MDTKLAPRSNAEWERRRVEAQLRYQAQLLAAVKDAIIATDEHQVIVFWNPAAAAIYGWRADEVIGRPIAEVLQTEFDGATHEAVLRAALEMGEYRGEVRQRCKDGSLVSVESIVRALRDAHGRPIGLVRVNRDITERKQMEAALHAGEELQRLVLNNIKEAVYLVQFPAGKPSEAEVRFVSDRIEALIGYQPYELKEKRGLWFSLLHPDDVPVIMERGALVRDQSTALEYRLRHKITGEYHWVEDQIALQRDEAGNVIGVYGVVRDITRRKQTEAERERLFELVQAGRERLQHLSQQLLEAQESERRRLAWEIHDDISQSLTGLMMQLGAVQSLLPKSSDRARAVLKEAETLTGKTLEGVRRMIADLRPPVLDDLGLAPALRRLGDELRERAEVDVAFEVSGLPERLPPQVENTLFRIAQEALTNIRKHAQAQHAAISLHVERERVTLVVKDDGVGLRSWRDQARRRGDVLLPGGWVVLRGHYGLVGIQERAALLGGTLQVQSAPGEGTTLRVELPR